MGEAIAIREFHIFQPLRNFRNENFRQTIIIIFQTAALVKKNHFFCWKCKNICVMNAWWQRMWESMCDAAAIHHVQLEHLFSPIFHVSIEQFLYPPGF